MKDGHRVTMLGTGLIGMFYTMTLHGQRTRDRVRMVYSRKEDRAESFARRWGIPRWTTSLEQAVKDEETDTVVIGLPNDQHLEAVRLAAQAGKAILCTKPLARNGEEARKILEMAEASGSFCGYLEDLVYTPKTLQSIQSVKDGALGRVLWVRSRETHPGPHSDWFWDLERAGGGAIVDLGCHCIEIIRNFIGKGIRPVEVCCWADTLVHPIEAEDHGIALIRFENGSVGQFEVSWAFRGGMDLRDEISGTEGTIWLDHFLRTGFEMFTAVGKGGYVAEKAEGETGWLFPVGDEVHELGYRDMFVDMFDAMDEGRAPMETFYDGYVVNSVIDACYRSVRSKCWEPIELQWRATAARPEETFSKEAGSDFQLIKKEKMPDGRIKLILKEKATGRVVQKFE